MGDKSIKGRSPILNGIDKRPKEENRFPRPFKRRQKARKVEEYKAEKPEPQSKLPTKQQRRP